MILLEAMAILGGARRYELRDHAFGDREITWITTGEDEKDVGSGYFSGSCSEVSVLGTNDTWTSFVGDEADELSKCGTLSSVERNDSVGPDTYEEGEVMPGLTKYGVLEELTTPKK